MFGSFPYGTAYYGDVRAATVLLQTRFGDVVLIVVAAEERIIAVAASSRAVAVAAYDHTVGVPFEDRTIGIATEQEIRVDDAREPS